MAVRKYFNEPTPDGAASWDVIFLDEKWQPIDETCATRYKIHEYDEHRRLIGEQSGFLGPIKG